MRVLVIALLAACGHPAIEGAVRVEGEHVVVEHDPSIPLCAPSVERADRFVVATSELLGTPVPDVLVHLYADGDTGCFAVVGHPTDCADNREVWAQTWIQYHEFVHVVAYQLGTPPPFLREGLAEALGNSYPYLDASERPNAVLAVEASDFFTGDVVASYTAAGDFVAFLLERYGPDAVRDLYESLIALADRVTVAGAFERHIGVALEDAIAAWHAWTPADPTALLLDTLACEAPVLAPVAQEHWTMDAAPTCVDDVSLAQRRDHRIEIPTSGMYRIDARLDNAGPDLTGTVTLDIGDCGGEPQAHVQLGDPFMRPWPSHVQLAWIDAGARWLSQWQTESRAPYTVSADITRAADPGATCGAAGALAVPATTWSIVYDRAVDAWPGTATDPELGEVRTTWFRIDLPAGSAPMVLLGASGRAVVRACQGTCGALANCIVVESDLLPTMWQPVADQPILVRAHAPLDAEKPGVGIGAL